jgi:hypothetical protein
MHQTVPVNLPRIAGVVVIYDSLQMARYGAKIFGFGVRRLLNKLQPPDHRGFGAALLGYLAGG